MKKYLMIVLAIMVTAAIMITGCTAGASESVDNTEKTMVDTEKETTTSAETIENSSEQHIELSPNETELIQMLGNIQDNVELGTSGSYMTAVRAASDLMNWGVGTSLTTEQVRKTTIDWLMYKGNDESVEFGNKFAKVYEAYRTLLGSDDKDLLDSAECDNAAYPWSDEPLDTIETIYEAVGSPTIEIETTTSEAWKKEFEQSLLDNYGMTPDHYEDLGDGVYQVYVIIDGKSVPYVTVDSKTGDYHG